MVDLSSAGRVCSHKGLSVTFTWQGSWQGWAPLGPPTTSLKAESVLAKAARGLWKILQGCAKCRSWETEEHGLEKRLMEQGAPVQPEGGKQCRVDGAVFFMDVRLEEKEEEERLDRQGTCMTSKEMSIWGGRGSLCSA